MSCILGIYQSILARGYFPKELPPAFSTRQFASYAETKSGRQALKNYHPSENMTECVKYRLASAGRDYRELRLIHPYTFCKLAEITAKNFKRLLKAANASTFSKSKPLYDPKGRRAIQPRFSFRNLARERSAARAGASFLLKADVNQFYPAMYTHAVAWAVDPKTRKRENWNSKKPKILGNKLDQALVNTDGKISQGIPIGNDISFLLAELVLAQVDKTLKLEKDRAYRWYDDYEIAYETREQAERALLKLSRELERFRLRLNPNKTRIVDLPEPTDSDWRDILFEAAQRKLTNPREMVRYFDAAFRLRASFTEAPVLAYALGNLFKIVVPSPTVARIAQSCIKQALLCEPGTAQNAVALLSFWRLNGLSIDTRLMKDTITRIIIRHASRGPSNDLTWALAFCLNTKISLDKDAAKLLSTFDDDTILIESLHMRTEGLLSVGFSESQVSRTLKTSGELDREHWLVAYESVRHGFLNTCESMVKSNTLFSDLLSRQVTFYRRNLPPYALVLYPGGAPDWTRERWLIDREGDGDNLVIKMIADDLAKLTTGSEAPTIEMAVEELMELYGEKPESEVEESETAYY